MHSKIDFVILWVDGNDKNWLEEKKKYNSSIDVDAAINRYRDWDNLKYWFRGVEKFAPWVHKIYFVTWGHLPTFLNTSNPKIKIINHKDIINEDDLPTFNSNAIEANIYKIPNLSNQFVLFNDDMFIIKETKSTDFFKNGLPRDEYAENPIAINSEDTVFPHTLLNNMAIINKHYKKKNIYKKNFLKYLNFKYGKALIKTISQLPYKDFTGIYNPHIPQSFLKEYYYMLNKIEPNILSETSKNKFRSKNDYTQYLIRYMQLLDGSFIPRKHKFGCYYIITKDNKKIINHIIKQKSNVICLNDTQIDINFEKTKKEINSAFEKILPEKSSFEK